MKNRLFIILGSMLMLAASGCKSQFDMLLASTDTDTKYEAAKQLYADKKYKKAASLFESLSMQTSGTEIDDSVRYFWAMSNYKYKDYTTAEANFNSFVEMYARSPFTVESRFMKLDCMYRGTLRYELDQAPTTVAIMSINEYLAEYPDTPYYEMCKLMLEDLQERLDRKEFENARLYYKMEDYIAAKTSLRNVLKDHPENRYREEVMYYLTKSAFKYAQLSVAAKQKDRYMDFVDFYYNFVGEYPESKFRAELDQMYNRYQRNNGNVEATRKSTRAEKKVDKGVDKVLRKDEKEVMKAKEAADKQKDKTLHQ